MSEFTEILDNAERGDAKAAEELMPLVYEELRRLAASRMAQQQPGHTLQPTALVHEAWLRLTGAPERKFEGRTHFFFAAAEAMRHILVDWARRKSAGKHGGDQQRAEFEEAALVARSEDDRILEVNDAVEKLASENKLAADIVKLRYFAGLTLSETAASLGISERTADNYWAYAKAWLYRAMRSPQT